MLRIGESSLCSDQESPLDRGDEGAKKIFDIYNKAAPQNRPPFKGGRGDVAGFVNIFDRPIKKGGIK